MLPGYARDQGPCGIGSEGKCWLGDVGFDDEEDEDEEDEDEEEEEDEEEAGGLRSNSQCLSR